MRLDTKNYHQLLASKLDNILQLIQERQVVNPNPEAESVENLYSSLQVSLDSSKLDMILSKLDQNTESLTSIDEVLQTWESSGLSLEEGSFEPVLESTHCPSLKVPKEILESLQRIERSQGQGCAQPEVPGAVIELIDSYGTIKRTILDIR